MYRFVVIEEKVKGQDFGFAGFKHVKMLQFCCQLAGFFSTEKFFIIFTKTDQIKGIFSDSNKIFLWHETKDINKKGYFQNFS